MKLTEVTRETLVKMEHDEALQNDIVKQMYNLAWYFIKEHQIFGYCTSDYDDYGQDLIMHIWKVKSQFNETKANFSTFCSYCWNNLFKMKLRNKTYLMHRDALKLDRDIPGSQDCADRIDSYADLISDASPCTLERLLDSEYNAKISKLLSNCKYATRAHFEGQIQKDTARELGISQSYVSRMVRKDIKTLRERYREEGDLL